MQNCVCVAVLVSLSLLATDAHAAITFYSLFVSNGYEQTSNAQPTIPLSYSGDVSIDFNNAGDLTAANVTSPSPLSPMTLNLGTLTAGFGQTYASAAQRDTNFPPSAEYQFNISGGILGSQSASLSRPGTDAFAPDVPYFTGTTYDDLQGVDATTTIILPFTGYAAPLGVNDPLIFIGITRVSDGALVYGDSGPNTLTSFTVPVGTLQPNTDYDVNLVYSSRISIGQAGFGTATSQMAFDLRTDLFFTTGVPEPSTIALAALASLAILSYRRRAKTCD